VLTWRRAAAMCRRLEFHGADRDRPPAVSLFAWALPALVVIAFGRPSEFDLDDKLS
jgi:hypothetical protein